MESIVFIIPEQEKEFRTDLPVGGTDAEGNVYAADGRSLMINGHRLIPVMGEFHFSRFEPQFWREELLKMKAGGVDIVATYLLWIHHEEKQGEWDFSGCRDIRRFLTLCRECGLKVWLRIGPWAHGECRNGGFPDWLQNDESFEKRINDPKYLELVRIWFEKISHEVQGLLAKDGGPVIGIQLENEYGHCGGPADRGLQKEHMKTLYRMAREAGLIVPWYTATAWGGACTIDETLQVLGGYVDAPWDESTEKLPPKRNFLFCPHFDDAETGSDFEKAGESRSTIRKDYPYLTAELGGGLQVTSHRRPVTTAKDNEAAILCALGSGANLLGYYMYHGGINPDGKYSTLNEAFAIGGHTNTPVKSYDFDACLNEAGKANESFGGLKKYALFLKAFGEELAGTEVILPETGPSSASDFETPRAALRFNRRTGDAWLFVNNHQRNWELASHPEVQVQIRKPDGSRIVFDKLSFAAGNCYLYRANLYQGNARLFAANPLTRLGEQTVYYKEGTGFSGSPENAAAGSGPLTLTEAEANRAYLLSDGLYVTQYADSILIEDGGEKKLISTHREERVKAFRDALTCEELLFAPGGDEAASGKENGEAKASFACIHEQREKDEELLYRDYRITVRYPEETKAHRLFLNVDYAGDRAEVYLDGRLADDWFTTGKPWNILLDRFGRPEELTIRVYDSGKPLRGRFGEKVYYDLPVKKGCEILSVQMTEEYLLSER